MKSSAMAFSVLIVDDNPADQRLTAIRLRQGWPSEDDMGLDFAADGRQALAKLGRAQYRLLLLDWNLPDMNGGELLRELRARGSRAPAVIVSGWHYSELPVDWVALGASYVSKEELAAGTLQRAIAEASRRLGSARPLHPIRSARE